MRTVRISNSSLNFFEVNECVIHESQNEHGRATMSGIVYDTEEEIIKNVREDIWNTIYACDEYDNKKVLFSGIVEGITIEVCGNIRKVKIDLVSGTILMDRIKKTIGYQDETITYSQIIKEKSINNNATIITVPECDETIDDFLVQYKETDWKFAMRVASKLNLPLSAGTKRNEVYAFVGLFSGENSKLDLPTEYSMKRLNGVSGDIVEFESDSIIELGANLFVKNNSMYVYRIDGRYEGSELIFNYELRTLEGCKVNPFTNLNIVGASLDASVEKIEKDKVKIKLNIDGKPAIRLFPFSSVYSSPDGTGWYCMPEIGDAVRLYFPSDYEKDSYVINAVHVSDSNAAAAMRDNPDNKVLMNKYGKMIKLSASGIEIRNTDGMYINLMDDTGIIIRSDKDINLEAEEKINIVSINDTISMLSPSLIKFKQDGTELTLQEDITIKGGQLNIQQ